MLYIRYPLSLRQVEDLLFKRDIEICHETVRFCWNRFGPSMPKRAALMSSTGSTMTAFYLLPNWQQ